VRFFTEKSVGNIGGHKMGMDKAGGLPPAFMAKMQLHWNKVQGAFKDMDRDNSGKIQRNDFDNLCTRFGCDMSPREMDQVPPSQALGSAASRGIL